jgi:antitoxin MazE
LALRIPKSFAEEAGVGEGGEVELSVRDGKLVAEPVRPPRFTLQGLLAGIRTDRRHGEKDFGGPVGREAW